MKFFNLVLIFLFISCNPLSLVEDEEISSEFFKGNNPCATNALATKYNEIGSGTSSDPYWICNAEQLVSLADHCNFSKGLYESCDHYYSQGKDINFDGEYIEPIGDTNYNFNGKYYGYGYTIRDLDINLGSTHVGLFGYLGNNARIEGIVLEDAYVYGTGTVGLLVGYNNGGKIHSIEAHGNVDSSGGDTGGLIGYSIGGEIYEVEVEVQIYHTGSGSSIGGIVGGSFTTIDYCYSEGSLTTDAANGVGGIVGHMDSAEVIDCYSSIAIDNTNVSGTIIGGIAGYFLDSDATVVGSDSTIDTSNSSPASIGGLFGRIAGASIDQCAYGGTINGQVSTSYVGGIIGTTNATAQTSYISNCYSHSDIYGGSGGTVMGGILAEVGTTDTVYIENVYNTVRYFDATGTIEGILGTTVGSKNISEAYFDVGATGSPSSTEGGTGLNDSSLRANSTYSSWDFSKWRKSSGDYPQLIGFDFLE
jgi:hypothetical protein